MWHVLTMHGKEARSEWRRRAGRAQGKFSRAMNRRLRWRLLHFLRTSQEAFTMTNEVPPTVSSGGLASSRCCAAQAGGDFDRHRIP